MLEANGGTSSNSLTIKGLNDNNTDSITYYLYEVKAPDGYNKLTAPIEIQIAPAFDTTETAKVTRYTLKYKTPDATDYSEVGANSIGISAHTFNVVTVKGSLLQSTGGIGTSIFYIGGGILIAIAAIVLIIRSKKKA